MTRTVNAIVATFAITLGAVGVVVAGAPPASAQGWQCEGGEQVERRTLECGDKDEGDGGDDGGDGGDGDTEPPDPPPDGTKRWNTRTFVCSEQECPRDIWCTEGHEPIVYEERREVYRSAEGGWVPVAGPEGQWTEERTSCELAPENEPTEDEVRRAVNNFGLAGAKPTIEPPGGRTLVNVDTYFYTERTEVEPFTVQVGPVDVEVRATARSYEWDFGDGHGTTTQSPGAPHPDGNITHKYEETGSFQPSVTVHYDVEWRYGDSGWQQMGEPMTATSSPPVDLQVVESRGRLSDND